MVEGEVGDMNLRIQMTITDNEGHTEIHPVDVEVAMPETGPMLIDDVEQEILRVNRDVIRTTIAAYLEELSKKKPAIREELMTLLSQPMPIQKSVGSHSIPTRSLIRPDGPGTPPPRSSRP